MICLEEKLVCSSEGIAIVHRVLVALAKALLMAFTMATTDLRTLLTYKLRSEYEISSIYGCSSSSCFLNGKLQFKQLL